MFGCAVTVLQIMASSSSGFMSLNLVSTNCHASAMAEKVNYDEKS